MMVVEEAAAGRKVRGPSRATVTLHDRRPCGHRPAPIRFVPALAIIVTVQAKTPPFRLVLGRSAVQRIRTKLDAQCRAIDAWEERQAGRIIPRHDWQHHGP
jgi:hypothetical protein